MLNSGLDIDRIGRWDGSQWHKVGNGIRGGIANVNCFEIYQGDLFVGGRFVPVNGNPGPNIARWDGQQWLDVGGGIDLPGGFGCDVRDMVVFEDKLYAVGTCELAGGITADRIAKWDGEEWCGFGDVFNNSITAIEVHQGELYIGGGFSTINDDTIYRVSKWVGGDFVDQCGTVSSVADTELEAVELTVYPNPTNFTATIELSGHSPQDEVSVNLYDVHGKLLEVPTVSRAENVTLDLSKLPTGMYFGQVFIGKELRTFKVVRD
jgi:hypothetical protein